MSTLTTNFMKKKTGMATSLAKVARIMDINRNNGKENNIMGTA
jgi:hypothetical protein